MMAVSINSKPGPKKKLGWLIWWTVHQANHPESDLKTAGAQASIPTWMVDRIKGRSPKSAWMAATQLGARGHPSTNLPGEGSKTRARYLSRDINMETPTRAIVREVTNEWDERVGSETVGLVRLWMDNLTDEVVAAPPDLEPELRRVLDQMALDMSLLQGKVGDSKVRSLLLDWLQKRHRICVRGSGGVYLVPRPKSKAKAAEIEAELLAVREWVSNPPIGSLFSIVELTASGATTVDVFVQSAVEEIRAELEGVEGRLETWAANDGMNAGSKMFSAGEMAKRCEAIAEKIAALKEALGEEVGVTEAMLDLVRAKAEGMHASSTIVVETAARERKREAEARGEAEGNGKKAGTARQRAKKRVL